MNKIKFLLIFIVLLSVGIAFAQNVAVGFKESSSATRTLVNLEFGTPPGYPTGYPYPTPATGFGKWYIQFYTDGGDGIISDVDSNGNPGGDDMLSTGIANTVQYLSFGPTGGLVMSSSTFTPVGGAGNTHPGSRIFLRIFNDTSIAAADKYFNFTGLYTITTATTQNVNILPTYGWSSWISKEITPLVSGSITSALSVASVIVECTNQSNYTTTSSGLFSFSVPTGANITITPRKTGYFFVPASRTYTNVQEAITGVDFAMTKLAPNTATIPVPSNGASGVSVTVGHVGWTFIPLDGYSLPTGFKVYFPSDTTTPVTVPYVGGVTTYTSEIPLLSYSTPYGWKVVPTNSNKGVDAEMGNEVSRTSRSSSKADAETVLGWGFTTEGTSTITPGITEDIDPDGNGSMGTFLFNTPASEVVPTTPVIVYSLIPLANVPELVGAAYIVNGFAMNMHTDGAASTSMDVTVPAGTWFVAAYYNGAWHHGSPYPATGVSSVHFDNVSFGAKGDVPLIGSQGGDPTLPVELSSFTALFEAGFYVQLTWVVQSETNHLGYNVMRSSTDVLDDAIQINQSFVSTGSSTGTQITYNYRDEDNIADNTTYYYWLQSVDLDNTTYFFGPVQVIINNEGGPEPPPVVPTYTELLNAYPNPFNPNTTIPYTLKSPGEVKFEIYNVKGQVVWSKNMDHPKAGYYQLGWNGKDNIGKSVSSGIYYYRMTSGKYTASKKIILVK